MKRMKITFLALICLNLFFLYLSLKQKHWFDNDQIKLEHGREYILVGERFISFKYKTSQLNELNTNLHSSQESNNQISQQFSTKIEENDLETKSNQKEDLKIIKKIIPNSQNLDLQTEFGVKKLK